MKLPGKVSKFLNPKQSNAPTDGDIHRGGLVTLGLKSAGHLLQYILAFAVSRLAGAGGFGTFSLYQSVTAFAAQTGRMGLDSVLMFETARDANAGNVYRAVMKITVPLAVVMTLVLWFAADSIAIDFFEKPFLAIYLRWSSLAVLPLCLAGVNAAYLKGKRRFEWFNFVQHIGVPLFALVGFLASFRLMPVESALLIAFVCAASLTFLLSLIGYVRNRNSEESTKPFQFDRQIKTASVFMAAGLMFFLRNNMELYLAGKFLDQSMVGVFRASHQLANLNGFILIAALVPATPQFASLFNQKNMTALAATAQQTTAYVMRGTLPIFLLIVLFGKPLLRLFGVEFTIGYDAMLIMSLGQLINALFGPVNSLLNACYKPHWVLWNMIAANVVCGLVGWFVVPMYGLVGAACVNLLGNVLMNVIPFFMVKQALGFYTVNLRTIFSFRRSKPDDS